MPEEFDLNVDNTPDDDSANATPAKGLQKSSGFLADMSLPKIASTFSDLRINDEDVAVIIPIGFPQAGKSLFLSSLLYYASKGEDTLFELKRIDHAPFQKGHLAADQMIDYFSRRKIYSATLAGTIDLIGLTISPRNSGRPDLNLALLDLAGEDIQNIKASKRGDFTDKINAVFNGLKANLTPILFFLITPFAPPKLNDEESDREAHVREDALHTDFMNYLEQNQPEIYANCQIFVIVSQWDRNLNEALTIEDYMSRNRQSLYSKIKSKNVVWGTFSVGRLLTQMDDDGKTRVQELVHINSDYPQRLWKKLYYICTHKHLDTWWNRLFS